VPPPVPGAGSGWTKAPGEALSATKQPREEDLSQEVKERLTKIRLFMAKGHCREASIDLKNLAKEQPALARVHYLLGAAMTCRRLYMEAWAAYGRAVQLDPSYKSDARILEDAQQLLRHKKAKVQARLAAANFLGTKVGKPALPVLLETASNNSDLNLRHHAVALVRWLKADDRIDWVTSLSLDLKQLPTCAERARIVKKLRELGDPRAIGALRKARDASVRVHFFKRRWKNGCCRDEIVETIKYLLARRNR
jgi:hypothetical protein